MPISEQRAERFAAYESSLVWLDHPSAGSLVMTPREPGVRAGDFPAAGGETIHVITAHNPGRLLSREQNDDRHRRLAERLAGLAHLTVWRAVGGDPAWVHTEECVALVGLDDEQARSLAAEFDQEAIWAWDAGALRLVECASGVDVPLGWEVGPWEGAPPGP